MISSVFSPIIIIIIIIRAKRGKFFKEKYNKRGEKGKKLEVK